MKEFKKKVFNLPFLLLLAFVVFLITKHNPSTADSIVVTALSILYGASLYLETKEQPDYSQEIYKLDSELRKEIKELKDNMNVINMGTKAGTLGKRISF